ncbi:trans-Golgi network integral membrane protein 2-like isoform X2 [Pocillopora damicornis]|uniref:trans-Golgi network integral membrane protein 2-like isoform X2 n=1 Tax=Pocillopora damicornis TaxID=46731 RepID=UPI000F550537|nr:trans-Golgi network integral membrane protein 2-like isoform X2 [Pocillopora damicornis]
MRVIAIEPVLLSLFVWIFLSFGRAIPNQSSICRQPMDTGLCRQALPRWYYNATTRKCEKFIFGGCKGNNNNFKTKDDCKRNCTGPEVAGFSRQETNTGTGKTEKGNRLVDKKGAGKPFQSLQEKGNRKLKTRNDENTESVSQQSTGPEEKKDLMPKLGKGRNADLFSKHSQGSKDKEKIVLKSSKGGSTNSLPQAFQKGENLTIELKIKNGSNDSLSEQSQASNKEGNHMTGSSKNESIGLVDEQSQASNGSHASGSSKNESVDSVIKLSQVSGKEGSRTSGLNKNGQKESVNEKTHAPKENGNLKLKSVKAESGNSEEENAVPQSHEEGNADLVNEPSSAAEEKDNAMPQSLERGNADSFDEKTQALKENGNLKLKSGKAESGNSKEENAVLQSHEGGNADLVNEPSSAAEEKENAMPQSPNRGNADLVKEPSSAAEEKDNAMPQSPKRGSTDSEEKNLQPDSRKGGRDDESEKNQNNRGRQSEGYRRGQEDREDSLGFRPEDYAKKGIYRGSDSYEHRSSHFAAYFLTSIVMVFAAYALYHNRQKIIAIIIEGKSDDSSRRRGYRKLETNVEEAMPSLKSANSTYVY